MHHNVLDVELTQGQLIWVLGHGELPSEAKMKQLVADIRYLRALGVPFEEKKRGKGRGNRLTYVFDEFLEICLAIAALRRGVRPKDAAECLKRNRRDIRSISREVLEKLPASAVDRPPEKGSRPAAVLRAGERFLRIHDRHSETPGKFEVIGLEATEVEDIFGMKEVFLDGAVRPLIPLTRLLAELAQRAPRVPEIRTGPG